MINLVQDQVVKKKRYTSRPKTVYLWQEVNISLPVPGFEKTIYVSNLLHLPWIQQTNEGKLVRISCIMQYMNMNEYMSELWCF